MANARDQFRLVIRLIHPLMPRLNNVKRSEDELVLAFGESGLALRIKRTPSGLRPIFESLSHDQKVSH
jgi:hypothetical protein